MQAKPSTLSIFSLVCLFSLSCCHCRPNLNKLAGRHPISSLSLCSKSLRNLILLSQTTIITCSHSNWPMSFDSYTPKTPLILIMRVSQMSRTPIRYLAYRELKKIKIKIFMTDLIVASRLYSGIIQQLGSELKPFMITRLLLLYI